MADHDDAQDYTANGPTDIGFRTDGTGIEKGVVASDIRSECKAVPLEGTQAPFFVACLESHMLV